MQISRNEIIINLENLDNKDIDILKSFLDKVCLYDQSLVVHNYIDRKKAGN